MKFYLWYKENVVYNLKQSGNTRDYKADMIALIGDIVVIKYIKQSFLIDKMIVLLI
uniref:Uncharacterized protein n=1 Tax=viral metagenome TaxID=1070528 RepID=A0A6C0J587_9ZZZZ